MTVMCMLEKLRGSISFQSMKSDILAVLVWC